MYSGYRQVSTSLSFANVRERGERGRDGRSGRVSCSEVLSESAHLSQPIRLLKCVRLRRGTRGPVGANRGRPLVQEHRCAYTSCLLVLARLPCRLPFYLPVPPGGDVKGKVGMGGEAYYKDMHRRSDGREGTITAAGPMRSEDGNWKQPWQVA